MGLFAVNAAVAHAEGSARGERSQLSASGVSLDLFLSTLGRAIDGLLLGQRHAVEAAAVSRFEADPSIAVSGLQVTRSADEPKSRWVDGTPEYSLYLPALRRLFPEARFIHLLRDPRDVVRSMLNFNAAFGIELVPGESEAWAYWLRTVRACVAAERAWGAGVVRRVLYRDLVEDSKTAVEGILEFLGEPVAYECLEPLRARINSSSNPDHSAAASLQSRSEAGAEAVSLYAQLEADGQAGVPGEGAAAAELDEAFFERVAHYRAVDGEYVRLLQRVRGLEEQLLATPAR